ncbi:hypothetical protein HUJ05_012675 [Dendroctonus ponderosae]|nr:hypothetical protein HUJ05_012675 [Dendroctonus ponderosae]
MASTRKVAVVTGSNKGIGFAIVKGLCEKYNGDVYLTSRDIKRGTAAVEALKQLGFPMLGYVDTDMSSHKGPLTTEEGAQAPLFLALEANIKGKALRSMATESVHTVAEDLMKAAKMEKCYENYILIDVGANLTNKKYGRDLDSVVQRAKDSGVQKIMVTGTSVKASKEALRLTRIYPGTLYSTAGYLCKDKSDTGVRKLLVDNLIPLDRLVVETDAPFMYPNTRASKLPTNVKEGLTER